MFYFFIFIFTLIVLILSFTGNDTDSLLSDKHRDDLDHKSSNAFDLDPSDSILLRRHTTSVGSSVGSTSSPPLNESLFSPLNAGTVSGSKLAPPGSLTNGVHSVAHGGCSNMTNLGSLGGGHTMGHTVGHTLGHTDTNTSEKPRIWSIADVATSSSTPAVRRHSPLGMSSHIPSKPGHTAFSPPAASPHGFQPWVNGGFSTPSSAPTTHTGLSYSSYHLGHHPMAGMGQVGGMSSMGAGHPRPGDLGSNHSVPCVNSLASPPSYTPKLSNGFLGKISQYLYTCNLKRGIIHRLHLEYKSFQMYLKYITHYIK